jgi:hypothetical protein
LNVSPMVPHLGRIEVSHPPSPLWMFHSRLVDWGAASLPQLQTAWT